MEDRPAIHENLSRDEATTEGSSDRVFGLVFAFVFTLIGIWPLFGNGGVRIWALVCSATFIMLALVRAAALAPVNRLWSNVGRILHKVVNPVITALLFFTAVTPTALLLRLMGKDLLHLRFDRGVSSYWIERKPPGPDPKTMRNQF